MIGRRELILLIGGAAAAWPMTARAQQPDRVKRVGVLMGATPENNPEVQARLAAFLQGLEELGWAVGRNIHIDYRFAFAGVQMEALAKELVALHPDVILAHATPAAVALHRETWTIPIVFASIGDPIGFGLIASLARPGGNFTGLTTYEASIAGKWLAMLKEIAPSIKRAGFVGNPKTTNYHYYLRAAEAPARSFTIELVPILAENVADIERGIGSFARVSDSGLVVLPDPTTTANSASIITQAAQHRLPAVYPIRFWVSNGGLMSYGTDRVDELRQAASFVDRILRGANPTDLPVQTPTKFETAINLKTARALGLVVPDRLLVAADEVIE
jgi:putative tryptophan/tyrosine transport system substrate-binding protein